MLILTIKTDNPKAEIGLYEDNQQLAYKTWEAHRQLAETLHVTIDALLTSQHKSWQDITGISCYKGPGSFTGLRIGMSVANALALGNAIPIIGGTGPDWLNQAINSLLSGHNDKVLTPEYGAEPHITQQKK